MSDRSTMELKVSIDCPHCAEKIENALNENTDIRSAELDFEKKILKVDTDLDENEVKMLALEASDEISFPDDECSCCCHEHTCTQKHAEAPMTTPTLEFHPVIDCPVCAGKVEDALNARNDIEKAEYNFSSGRLRVWTRLPREEVVRICRKTSDEIEFPEEVERKTTTYEFRPVIDCPVCAKKVETGLENNPEISKADYNFSQGRLRVTTVLGRLEVMELASQIEDEIAFPEEEHTVTVPMESDTARLKGIYGILAIEGDKSTDTYRIRTYLEEDEIASLLGIDNSWKDYSFKAVIDCAACAAKVERKLASTKGINNVHFNFEKARLTLSSTLSRDEIVAICKGVEDEIGLYDESTFEYDRKISSKAMTELSKIDGITKVEKKGNHLFITSTLDRKKVDGLVRAIPESDWTLYRIIIAAALFMVSELSGIKQIAILSYIIAGYDVLFRALKNITKGHVFDENFLMSIATVGALIISSYEEAAGVMIFYQIGEYFQKKALGRSRQNISNLLDLTEDEVTVVDEDGTMTTRKAESVEKGERIIVHAGEKISLDGIILQGISSIDEKSITGESIPRNVKPGDRIPSGAVNGEGVLTVEAETTYEDSTAMRIMHLIKDGEEKKAKSEKFITRFSRYYTPAVCLITLLVALIPPLFFDGIWKDWLYRGLMLLVISCPCALVLSVPLSYFASIGSFARRGILVKNAESIEKLSKITTMAFDKTGTLTEGNFHVSYIECNDMEEDEFITIAASLEALSRHPIAKAVSDLTGKRLDVADFKEIAGRGIEGRIAGHDYSIGRKEDYSREGLAISLEKDGKEVGFLIVEDTLKSNARDTIERLKSHGIRKTVMLSGDRRENAVAVGDKAGIDIVKAPLLPHEKLDELEKLIASENMVAYVGDGINDAPGLVRADVGISMGSIGSDAAIEASDCVIMNDSLESIDDAVAIARKTERIVMENIYFSILVKVAVMVLGIAGIANMWMAVFADTGVAFIATLNAMRALRYRRK